MNKFRSPHKTFIVIDWWALPFMVMQFKMSQLKTRADPRGPVGATPSIGKISHIYTSFLPILSLEKGEN